MKILPLMLSLAAAAVPLSAQDTAPAAVAAAEKFDLKLDRPVSAGDKLEIKVEAAFSRSLDIWQEGVQAPAQSTNLEAELEGTYEITAVTSKARQPSAGKVTVKKLSVNDGSGSRTLLEAGSVIEAKAVKGGNHECKVDGGDVDAELKAVILLVFPSLVEADVGEQETFAPAGPVGVNEPWTLDPKKLCEFYAEAGGLSADPAGTSGISRIVRKKEVAGVPCVIVEGTMTMSMKKVQGLPEKSKLEKCTLQMEVQNTLPVDPALHNLGYRVVSEQDLTFEMSPQESVTLRVRARDHTERKVTQQKL